MEGGAMKLMGGGYEMDGGGATKWMWGGAMKWMGGGYEIDGGGL